MSTDRPRWETSLGWYVVYWVLIVLLGYMILGGLLNTAQKFPQYYLQQKAMAFESLAGALIGLTIEGFIFAFCIRRLMRIQKARKEHAAETKRGIGEPSPVFVPHLTPASGDAALLNALKEELFSLESERLSGKLTPEEYAEAKAVLETRLKQASEVSVLDSAPLTSTEHENEQALKKPNRVSLWIAVPILAVLGWTALLVFHRYGFSAETTGYWIGTLLIPFLIAYAIAGAKRRRNWVTFSYWFLALGIILPGATNQKSLMSLSHSDMVRELVGSKPLEENLPKNEREMASAIKAVFADLRTFRKSHDEQVEALEPTLDQLYTSASFSSKEAMTRAMDAVDRELNLDREASAMVEKMPESLKAHLDQTGLSESEKTDCLKGFMESFNNSEFLSARQQAMAVESDWAQSADDLYGFALKHASEIVLTKDSIVIASDPLREKFNQKLVRSEGLHDSYLAAAKKVEEVRAANMKRFGVTEADLGLDK